MGSGEVPVEHLQYFCNWDMKQQKEHLKGKYSLLFLNRKYLGFIIHKFSIQWSNLYYWTIYVFIYIHIYISSDKKNLLYVCLNAALMSSATSNPHPQQGQIVLVPSQPQSKIFALLWL